MMVGEEVEVQLEPGRMLLVKLLSIQEASETDGTRTVIFEVNGEQWYIPVTDLSTEGASAAREKAKGPGDVGSPMPGVVVDVKVKLGSEVEEGETVAVLSAMKMETSIPATKSGTIKKLVVNVGDKVDGDDLLMEIE
mmetsp:Transcript_1399/g.1194  ORF Transcript_1399/g.1194 Transcript_1399/m.1194 type:complete len:137 (-) Transcript_1399:8-418(-)